METDLHREERQPRLWPPSLPPLCDVPWLRFTPGDGDAADPDSRVLSDRDLEEAVKEGERRH